MKILILGLTITSSWGNGHATTFRSLCRALHARGHHIDFLEKDVEWYASHRDLPAPPYCRVWLYSDWTLDGRSLALRLGRDADVVVVGSYYPDAIEATRTLLDQVTAPITFYDIDTPITLAALRAEGKTDYIEADLIPAYSAYISFSGGPTLAELMSSYGSPLAVPLYCSVDAQLHRRVPAVAHYRADLSYLGTYAEDRQVKLAILLDAPARALRAQRFLVAGPMYPKELAWAENTRQLSHVPPSEHPAFYSSSRFTLNLTRAEMVRSGYSPSVRLFEAAACGAAIVSDTWEGLDEFLTPGWEIVTATDTESVVQVLTGMDEAERVRMGSRARERILSAHTSEHRAAEFEQVVSRLGTAAVAPQPAM